MIRVRDLDTHSRRERTTGRDARVHRSTGSVVTPVIIVLSLVTMVVLVGALTRIGHPDAGASADATLVLYCAAGTKPPVEAAIRRFEDELGGRVGVQYGGSGTLLSQIAINPSGDLYIAADDSYMETARRRGLVEESIPLATIHPVIAVPAGNPKGIRTLQDLLRPDVRLAMANPDAAAIGRVTRELLENHGVWSALEAHCRVFKPTVNDVAVDVKLGTVDAAIVWDSTVAQIDGLDRIDIELFADAEGSVQVGILSASKRPAEALRLARYLGAIDRGGEEFDRLGYTQVERDRWSTRPKLLLFADSMFNPAIDETIRDFEQREDAEVTRVFVASGLDEATRDSGNRKLDAPQGEVLLNDASGDGLDAAVVDASNAAAAGDAIEIVSISSDGALAIQLIAVARETPYPRMMQRLIASVLEAASQARGEHAGFPWNPGADG